MTKTIKLKVCAAHQSMCLCCYLCWLNCDYFNACSFGICKSISITRIFRLNFYIQFERKKKNIRWVTIKFLFDSLQMLNTLYLRRQYLMVSFIRFYPQNNRLLISTKYNAWGESRFRKFDKKTWRVTHCVTAWIKLPCAG